MGPTRGSGSWARLVGLVRGPGSLDYKSRRRVESVGRVVGPARGPGSWARRIASTNANSNFSVRIGLCGKNPGPHHIYIYIYMYIHTCMPTMYVCTYVCISTYVHHLLPSFSHPCFPPVVIQFASVLRLYCQGDRCGARKRRLTIGECMIEMLMPEVRDAQHRCIFAGGRRL